MDDEATILEIKTTIALPFHSDHFDNVSRAMMAKESAR